MTNHDDMPTRFSHLSLFAKRKAGSRGRLGQMSRRKFEITGHMNERDFPHIVELELPPGGFRNRALVLDTVARLEPITRAQLAARTGLTKSSVSSIVQELLAAGLVVEQGAQRGRDLGRPGTALTLARDGLAGLGLEVNVDYLAACVVDLARRSRVQFVEVGDNRGRDPAAVAELLARLAESAVAAAATQGLTIAATCVAVPGLVDQDTGTVSHAPNLDWHEVPLRRLLEGRVPAARTPVLVENEANVAALGELWFGDGAGLGDYVHISGEVGIG